MYRKSSSEDFTTPCRKYLIRRQFPVSFGGLRGNMATNGNLSTDASGRCSRTFDSTPRGESAVPDLDRRIAPSPACGRGLGCGQSCAALPLFRSGWAHASDKQEAMLLQPRSRAALPSVDAGRTCVNGDSRQPVHDKWRMDRCAALRRMRRTSCIERIGDREVPDPPGA